MGEEVNIKNVLVVVLDTNPVWWGKQFINSGNEILLNQYLNSILVFINSHLMLSHNNLVAVIAAHVDTNYILYPLKEDEDLGESDDPDEPQMRGEPDGKYELFAQVNKAITDKLKSLILEDTSHVVSSDSILAGAMAMSLCYINRLEQSKEVWEKLSSRILIVKGSEDNPSQYMNLMNIVFSAQKQNVVIDTCVLDNECSLLQQACDITGGIYLKIPLSQGLLQYLLWVFLLEPSMRDKTALPPKKQVDYRAACFCHRNLIDIGYVCSVCLSVYCAFSPICSTCNTTFKLPMSSKVKKEKKDKRSSIS